MLNSLKLWNYRDLQLLKFLKIKQIYRSYMEEEKITTDILVMPATNTIYSLDLKNVRTRLEISYFFDEHLPYIIKKVNELKIKEFFIQSRESNNNQILILLFPYLKKIMLKNMYISFDKSVVNNLTLLILNSCRIYNNNFKSLIDLLNSTVINLKILHLLYLDFDNINHEKVIFKLVKLEYLKIKETELNDVNVENLTKLMKLQIIETNLYNIDGLLKLTNLTDLNLSRNNIINISLNYLIYLRNINIFHNNLKTIELDNLVNAKILNLSHNREISKINLSKLTNLDILDISFIGIKEILIDQLKMNDKCIVKYNFNTENIIRLIGFDVKKR